MHSVDLSYLYSDIPGLSDLPLSEQMIFINERAAEVNAKTTFSGSEIAYTKFLEGVETEYARQCIMIAGLFTRVYELLHIDVQQFGRELNPMQCNHVKRLYTALSKQNKIHLLTDGLTEQVISRYLCETNN